MTPEEYQEQLRQFRASRPVDPNEQRVGKIMAAMGLSSNVQERGSPESHIFRELTGTAPDDLVGKLGEWERAPGWKVLLGRVAARNMLDEQDIQQYLGKVAQLKKDWEGDPDYMLPLQQIEQKLRNPKTAGLLQQHFKSIRRPADIDRIPVESVTSRIIP